MAQKKAAPATRSKAATLTVVEPENQTVTLVKTDATAVVQWAANIMAFLQGANDLEMAAKARLVRMEGLAVPKSGAEDAQIQELVRMSNAGKKETTDYWYITRVFDKMHSWATTGRKRGLEADDMAATIGNRLHATYVDLERRRAQAEEDRILREREEAARAERQRELDRLEAEALKAEAGSPDLSERERNFVGFFVGGSRSAGNGNASAAAAGYRDAIVMGTRLLNMPKIKKAIEAAQTAIKMREQAAAVKAAPVEVETPQIRPDIQKGGDRTTYSADIYDEKEYVKAIATGNYGVKPEDALDPNLPFANKLANSMRENVNRIPGIRLRKTTRVV